ncbi:hypothetical protein [Streptomyces sp. ISBFB 2968]|uniref:hypothetical protein n=1 Tax=Streptomyces sp. ISBFB 2968 TaxID=2903527 RepID=UPI002FDBFAF0
MAFRRRKQQTPHDDQIITAGEITAHGPADHQGLTAEPLTITGHALPPDLLTSTKIADGVVESGKVDPNDPLHVHTLVKFALRKLGMSQEEADRYAAAHQQHAVDAYRATED